MKKSLLALACMGSMVSLSSIADTDYGDVTVEFNVIKNGKAACEIIQPPHIDLGKFERDDFESGYFTFELVCDDPDKDVHIFFDESPTAHAEGSIYRDQYISVFVGASEVSNSTNNLYMAGVPNHEVIPDACDRTKVTPPISGVGGMHVYPVGGFRDFVESGNQNACYTNVNRDSNGRFVAQMESWVIVHQPLGLNEERPYSFDIPLTIVQSE